MPYIKTGCIENKIILIYERQYYTSKLKCLKITAVSDLKEGGGII